VRLGLCDGKDSHSFFSVVCALDILLGVPFTYRLDGAVATYLGKGDQHDAMYDAMVHSVVLEGLLDKSLTDRSSTYSGLPVNQAFCPIGLKVYPSADYEANYKTQNPVLMTILATSIFVFTSLVFVGYDLVVSRRQKIVLKRAIESGAIVSSLFPEDVRKKLYQEQEAKQKIKLGEKRTNFGVVRDTEKAMAAAATADPINSMGMLMIADSNQIAKLYDNTTVFFADLAGKRMRRLFRYMC
jgi:hypothetical protein